MAIRLISEDERVKHMIGSDAWVFYRRVPRPVREKLAAKHTKRGVLLDDGAYNYGLVSYAITGWGGNVVDQHGEPFNYSEERRQVFLMGLPEDVYMAILQKVNEADADFEGELKNSENGLNAVQS